MNLTGFETSPVIALAGTAATYSNTGSSAVTFTLPTTLLPTDVIIAMVTNSTNGSGASITGVPGASGGFSWNAPDSTVNPNGGMATNMYWKQVGTDTPGTTTYSWTTTATTRNCGVLQAFRGPWPLNPIDSNGADHATPSSGTSTTSLVLPSGSSHNVRAAIVAGMGWRNGTTALTNNSLTYGTSGLTQIALSQSGSTGANNNGVAALAWITRTGTLASSTLTMNNSSQYGGFLWGLIPTPLGPVVIPLRMAALTSGIF